MAKTFNQEVFLVGEPWHAYAVGEENLKQVDKVAGWSYTKPCNDSDTLAFKLEQLKEVHLNILLYHNPDIAQTLLSQHAQILQHLELNFVVRLG